MKHIGQLVHKVSVAPEKYVDRDERQSIIDPQSAQIVNLLFAELKAIYPAWRHAWPNQNAEDVAKTSWTKAFTTAGLSNIQQIKFAVERCRSESSPFMPSSGQFLQWCRPTPEMLGAPSNDIAYLQACSASHPSSERKDLHPAVYHAATETGLFLLLNQPESKSRPMFDRAYDMTIGMLAKGEILREIPKALPNKPNKPKNLKAGRSALAELKRKVGKI